MEETLLVHCIIGAMGEHGGGIVVQFWWDLSGSCMCIFMYYMCYAGLVWLSVDHFIQTKLAPKYCIYYVKMNRTGQQINR